MAEFREIRHVGPSLQRSIKKKAGLILEELPEEFTLNTGHVKFFYTRGLFLAKRFQSLRDELLRRKVNINLESSFDLHLFPEDFQNDWVPTDEAKRIIRERIKERIAQKPGFYRYYGEKID